MDPIAISSDRDHTAIFDGAGSRESYFGGKSGSGTFQSLINNIPPHRQYIETHLGAGAIMRMKFPAVKNYGIDIDKKIIDGWSGGSAFQFVVMDAVQFIKNKCILVDLEGAFIYCDPPYLIKTRKSGKQYRFEYSERQHVELLETILTVGCDVMISGYWSELYNDILSDWNSFCFESMTRHGKCTEWVWFNYPRPTVLHDYQYLGDTYRERERIKRKRNRRIRSIKRMPALERNALLSEMGLVDGHNR